MLLARMMKIASATRVRFTTVAGLSGAEGAGVRRRPTGTHHRGAYVECSHSRDCTAWPPRLTDVSPRDVKQFQIRRTAGELQSESFAMGDPVPMGWTVEPLDIDDESLWRAWRQLSSAQELQHPCLQVDYVRTALRVFAAVTGQLWIARFRDERQADGALAILARRGLGQWSTYRIPPLAISPILIGAGDAGALHLPDVLASLSGLAWNLRLYDCDPRYQGPVLNQKERGCHLPSHVTVAIDTTGRFADYWPARPRSLRSRLSSALRKARASQELRLLRVEAPDRMADAVGDHARLERSGWKGNAGSAMRVDDKYGRFYREVLQAFAQFGGARVYQLMLGEQLIASQLCTVAGGTLMTMKTAYENEAAAFSPGRVLDYLMLEELFADPLTERVEYCIHASANDLAWATSHRPLQQIDLLRNRALTQALRLKRRVLRHRLAPVETGETVAVTAP